jgi:ABC-type multidrug transport system permease subunit
MSYNVNHFKFLRTQPLNIKKIPFEDYAPPKFKLSNFIIELLVIFGILFIFCCLYYFTIYIIES